MLFFFFFCHSGLCKAPCCVITLRPPVEERRRETGNASSSAEPSPTQFRLELTKVMRSLIIRVSVSDQLDIPPRLDRVWLSPVRLLPIKVALKTLKLFRPDQCQTRAKEIRNIQDVSLHRVVTQYSLSKLFYNEKANGQCTKGLEYLTSKNVKYLWIFYIAQLN